MALSFVSLLIFIGIILVVAVNAWGFASDSGGQIKYIFGGIVSVLIYESLSFRRLGNKKA